MKDFNDQFPEKCIGPGKPFPVEIGRVVLVKSLMQAPGSGMSLF